MWIQYEFANQKKHIFSEKSMGEEKVSIDVFVIPPLLTSFLIQSNPSFKAIVQHRWKTTVPISSTQQNADSACLGHVT